MSFLYDSCHTCENTEMIAHENTCDTHDQYAPHNNLHYFNTQKESSPSMGDREEIISDGKTESMTCLTKRKN